MKRFTFILAACILYPASYGICDWYHFYHIDPWTKLRHVLYSLTIALVGVSSMFKSPHLLDPFSRLLQYILIFGMVVPNILDRSMKDYSFHWYDPIYILVAAYGALKEILPVQHKAIALLFINERTYNSLCQNRKLDR